MRFDPPLVRGTLLRRYKRFLADVRLDDGRTITAHVANTGAMTGCRFDGGEIALSHHDDPKRKLPWSWQLTKTPEGAWICVNTALANRVVEEALREGRIESLRGYVTIRREVPYGEGSRIDFLLERGAPESTSAAPERCYVEVKNVTLRSDDSRVALFPDAVTTRGQKHVDELRRLVRDGHRAVLLLCVNRTDCSSAAPADAIDPTWAAKVRAAAEDGVEVLAYRTRIDPTGVAIDREVPARGFTAADGVA